MSRQAGDDPIAIWFRQQQRDRNNETGVHMLLVWEELTDEERDGWRAFYYVTHGD